jgi:hypothetical protein
VVGYATISIDSSLITLGIQLNSLLLLVGLHLFRLAISTSPEIEFSFMLITQNAHMVT